MSYDEDFEQAQADIFRLEQEFENAKARRDEASRKVKENLDKAKAANTVVRSLKNQLPAHRTAVHCPTYLFRVATIQFEGCLVILKDIIRRQ